MSWFAGFWKLPISTLRVQASAKKKQHSGYRRRFLNDVRTLISIRVKEVIRWQAAFVQASVTIADGWARLFFFFFFYLFGCSCLRRLAEKPVGGMILRCSTRVWSPYYRDDLLFYHVNVITRRWIFLKSSKFPNAPLKTAMMWMLTIDLCWKCYDVLGI